MTDTKIEKPTIKLVGTDGNAFSLLAKCKVIATKNKWSKEYYDTFFKEATSGDYNHLLAIIMKYFNVK